jgi:hypothetical protein
LLLYLLGRQLPLALFFGWVEHGPLGAPARPPAPANTYAKAPKTLLFPQFPELLRGLDGRTPFDPPGLEPRPPEKFLKPPLDLWWFHSVVIVALSVARNRGDGPTGHFGLAPGRRTLGLRSGAISRAKNTHIMDNVNNKNNKYIVDNNCIYGDISHDEI